MALSGWAHGPGLSTSLAFWYVLPHTDSHPLLNHFSTVLRLRLHPLHSAYGPSSRRGEHELCRRCNWFFTCPYRHILGDLGPQAIYRVKTRARHRGFGHERRRRNVREVQRQDNVTYT